MRWSIIRTILVIAALAALIVYTMRLPDASKAPGTTHPAVAQKPAPSTPHPTLVVARPIAPDFVMPVQPEKRTHYIDQCFTTEPAFAAPVIWKENAVVAAALKRDWETVRKLIDAGAPVESTDQTGITALMIAAKQGNLEMLRAVIP